MKNLTAKYLSLMMLASLLGGTVQAGHDGYAGGGDNCCREYVCGCNPLYCGAWDLQVQGGVNPILWRNRGPVYGTNCTVTTAPLVTLVDAAPKFSSLFKVPWYVGGQVGYALSDNTRVFVEFNYSQANGKSAVVVDSAITGSSFTLSFAKYKLFDAYVGARYYWDRWCDRLAFFLGGKVGLTNHQKQNLDAYTLTFGTTPLVVTTALQVNNSNTVVSGGGHVGFDYCVCGNWSIVLTGEIVASCGPRRAGWIPIAAGNQAGLGGLSNVFLGAIGSELRFPVTLALRYSF